MRISDWSSDVCSSDLIEEIATLYRDEFRRGSAVLYWEDVTIGESLPTVVKGPLTLVDIVGFYAGRRTVYNVLKLAYAERDRHPANRSEEHTSELQSLMRISYAVFCLKKKNNLKSKISIQQSTHQP